MVSALSLNGRAKIRCTADERLPWRVTFNLASPENRRPLSFVSYFQVTKKIVPQLVDVLTSKQAEMQTDGYTHQLQREIDVIEAALVAWEGILEAYEGVNAQARGESEPPLTKAGDFFVHAEQQEPVCQQRKYRCDNSYGTRTEYRCSGANDSDGNPIFSPMEIGTIY